MDILKVSTAVTIVMGPMLDSTDGNSPETALTIAQADIRLSKNGGAYAQTNNVAGATHMEVGNFSVPLDTTDTGTLGKLRVSIHESGALAVWREFTIVPANVYDSLVLGTDVLTADVTQWLGTAAATPTVAGVPEVDVTHWLGSSVTANVAGQPTVDVTRIGASTQSLIDLKALADDGYDPINNKVRTDLVYIHGSALTETAGQLAAGFTKLFDVATPLLVASDVMRGTDSAYTGTPPTAAAIVNEWETQSQADPAGFHVNVLEIGGTAQTANDNGADINAILTDTNELQTDWVNGGRLDLILDACALEATVAAMNNISTAQVNTEVDTALADIKLDHLVNIAVDTNWATTVHLDSVLGHLADVGTTATFDRTTDSNEAIRNKQTDIETDTAEIGTAGGGLTDLGGMSTGMKAEVNAEADIALTDYDPPTDAEMIARTLPTADYVVTTDTIAGVTTATNLTNAPTNGDLTATMKTSVNTEAKDVLTVDTITDSYATDGNQPTIAQAILAIQQMMQDKSISGTTLTVKKPDGSTTAMTFTLDSATTPTSITRAT